MSDPKQIATDLLGAIDWQTDVSGFCTCPGQDSHTQKTGKKDCRISLDGAPTIFCFHSSCASAIADTNRQLRRNLSGVAWSIKMPGGAILRSGDILQTGGTILRKETIVAQPGDREVLEHIKARAEGFRDDLFDVFRWSFEDILRESPVQTADRDADEQFRTWLKLWPLNSHVWIGDVFDSGKPEHKANFRPVSDWYQIGPAMGNFTCGATFKPGTFSRSNESIGDHRFMVLESDTLTKDKVGAIFAYLQRRLHYRLHCVVDTAGKSIHGWFDAPRTKLLENRLKAALTVLGCDPKLFTYSQPVRVPGAWRDGKLQRLIWLAGDDNPQLPQVDVAADLGAIQPGLPEIMSLNQFVATDPQVPPMIVDGLLHQGSRMILGGTSKSNKTWCLLDMAISVASGQNWWGRKTTKSTVCYINFELAPWSIAKRIVDVCQARPECKGLGESLHLWNLRGHNTDLTMMRPKLEEQLARHRFGLIILDPAYKVLGDRDENSNGEISGLMNELEKMAQSSGASIVIAHHFAKGDSSQKEAGDRMSGAGTWVRDPDSILVMTPHEDPDSFTVTSILRNMVKVGDFVVTWTFPLMRLAPGLNPEALRKPQSKNKICSDSDFVKKAVGTSGQNFSTIVSKAQQDLTMSRRTAISYLTRLTDAGLISHNTGLYWGQTVDEDPSAT